MSGVEEGDGRGKGEAPFRRRPWALRSSALGTCDTCSTAQTRATPLCTLPRSVPRPAIAEFGPTRKLRDLIQQMDGRRGRGSPCRLSTRMFSTATSPPFSLPPSPRTQRAEQGSTVSGVGATPLPVRFADCCVERKWRVEAGRDPREWQWGSAETAGSGLQGPEPCSSGAC